MMSQQQNDELHEMTFEALLAAAEHISIAQLGVLCFHAGIPIKDVLAALHSERAYRKEWSFLEKQIEADLASRDFMLGDKWSESEIKAIEKKDGR